MMNVFPGGATIEVSGTFTKTVSDGTGGIAIYPSDTSDEVIFMYGQFASQTHAGGGDAMRVSYQSGATELARILTTTVDANQTVNIPTAEADAGVAVANSIGMHTIYQRLISYPGLLRIEFDDMKFATSETFTFYAKFRSRSGAALTVTPTGGTWT